MYHILKERSSVHYKARGTVSAVSFWQTHALSLRQYILTEPLKKRLVALFFQSLEIVVKNAPLLLLPFCQPVIKPKTVLTHLFRQLEKFVLVLY